MPATDQQPPKLILTNRTDWVVAPMVHGTHPQGHVLTVCVKTSYAFHVDGSLAPLQPPQHFIGEQYADSDDLTSELLHHNEGEIWKPNADVVLRGTCYQPGGVPATTAVCGFSLGAMRKQLHILGDRVWDQRTAPPSPGEPLPFTAMPLRWARALGRANNPDNPVGIGCNDGRLPNIEATEQKISNPDQRPPPVGVGPINRLWRPRAARSGSFDQQWQAQHPALPADFDWSHFNCAPADQQIVGFVRGDERVTLHGLHPQHGQLAFHLPGEQLRCLIEEDSSGEPLIRELPLVCDTVIIDSDEGWVSLLWRGITPISDELMREIRQVHICAHALSSPLTVDEMIADMALAKVEEHPLLRDAKAKVQARAVQVSGDLARFGIVMGAAELLDTTPLSAEQLARWPFNPHGEKDADIQAAFDQAEASAKDTQEAARKVLEKHGMDWDGLAAEAQAQPPPNPTDLLNHAMEQAEAAAIAQGEQAPSAFATIRQVMAGDDYGKAMAWLGEKAGPMAAAPAAPDLSLAPEAQGVVHGDPYALMADYAKEAAALPEVAPYADQIPQIQAVAAERIGQGPPQPDAAAVPPGSQPVPAPTLAPGPGKPAPPLARQPPNPQVASSEPLPDPLREPLTGAAAARYIAAGAPLAGQILSGSNFSGLNVSGRDFSSALLQRAQFQGADLSAARLVQACADGSDLSGANLQNADLSGASLNKVTLVGADLRGAVLDQCSLAGADLSGADFSGAHCDMTDFTGANLEQANFSGVIGEMPIFSTVQATGARFVGACLDTALFQDSVLVGCDFTQATLPGTHFIGSNATNCCFDFAQLNKTQFIIGCDCSDSSFQGVQGIEANFMWSRMERCDFTGAELARANLMLTKADGCNFQAASLREAIVREASLRGAVLDLCDAFRANLGRADCTQASLRGINAYNCDVTDLCLDQALVEGARFGGTPLAHTLGEGAGEQHG